MPTYSSLHSVLFLALQSMVGDPVGAAVGFGVQGGVRGHLHLGQRGQRVRPGGSGREDSVW